MARDNQCKEDELNVKTEELSKKQESFEEMVKEYSKSVQDLQHELCVRNKKVAQLSSTLTDVNKRYHNMHHAWL